MGALLEDIEPNEAQAYLPINSFLEIYTNLLNGNVYDLIA